jgi:hypothetical protein
MAAAAAPERVAAIVTSGFWDPRPLPEEPAEIDGWDEALRRGGTSALVDRFKIDMGEAFDREFAPWAQAVILRADPEALLASRRVRGTWNGIPDEGLASFPVPALLIAGELEDADDDAAKVAAMIPNGQSLRLPGSDTEGRASRAPSPSPPSACSSTAGSRGDLNGFVLTRTQSPRSVRSEPRGAVPAPAGGDFVDRPDAVLGASVPTSVEAQDRFLDLLTAAGCEVAVVEAIGADVEGDAVGDEVVGSSLDRAAAGVVPLSGHRRARG